MAEKKPAAYEEIVARYKFQPATTWMIGNSPKSDINPALSAGLNAVFIPHDLTWALEHESVTPAPEGRRLIQVDRFTDLQKYF